jgi:hypothetical protein
VAKGHIDNLMQWEWKPLHVDYGIPTYLSLWRGPEDVRFITENDVLVTIPECNPSGKSAIFRACLDNFSMYSVKPCLPNLQEKNWMPYTDNAMTNHVIYSLSPFCIKDVDSNTIETVADSIPLLNDYHGSTNGIRYMDEQQLFLVHINRERTYHRWLLFYPTEKKIKVSREFVFFQYSYIEFPLSLCRYGEKLYVSIGINDEAAYILEMSLPTELDG